MKRVQRTLLSALLVLGAGAGLATYAYFSGYEGDRKEAEREKEEKRLFRFGRSDVVSGELVRNGQAIRFQRDERGLFRLTAPVEWGADQEAIGKLIDHMVGMRADAEVGPVGPAAALADYGLEPAAISLTLKLADGSAHTLHVGAKHPMGEAYFVTTGAKERIDIAAAAFHWALDRDLFAFREKRVVALDAGVITTVQVTRDGALGYRLAKDGGVWEVAGPDGSVAKADPGMMERFLRVLTTDLKAESFATDDLDETNAEELARYGLDRPRLMLTIEGGGTRIGGVLGAAGDVETMGGPYMRISGTRTVVAVYEAFPRDVDKVPAQFRDRTLGRCDPAAAERVDILLGGAAPIALVRSGSGEAWRLAAPVDKPAKGWKVEAILRRFCGLRGVAIHKEQPGAAEKAEWRIDPPERRVTIRDAGGAALADVLIGKRFDERHVFAAAAGGDRVDLLDARELDPLPASADELVD